jgi:hypothetical protein
VKLPLLTRHDDRLFHVLQFDGPDAIGVYDGCQFIAIVSIVYLTVLSDNEYDEWKRNKAQADAHVDKP